MLYVAKGLLVMVITRYCTKLIVTLQSHFTRHPLFGNRCMLDEPSNQTTVLNTARAQCVWRCLSSEVFKVVSYNHRLNSCDLSMQLCDTVAFAANFSIIVCGIHRPLCSRWVPKSEFDEKRAVVFPQRLGGIYTIAVARKRKGTGLYPGKHQRFGTFSIIIADDESTFVKDDRGEILLMDSTCIWTWIPFCSPNELMVGAFLAGYDMGKVPLYVARAMFTDTYSIGYYKSNKMLGYFTFEGGVRTSTTMDILVVL